MQYCKYLISKNECNNQYMLDVGCIKYGNAVCCLKCKEYKKECPLDLCNGNKI